MTISVYVKAYICVYLLASHGARECCEEGVKHGEL